MNTIKQAPTCELVKELAQREGVAKYDVELNVPFKLSVNGVEEDHERQFGFGVDAGPAVLLVVID